MIDVRRAAERFRTGHDGVQTWHSFSAGRHYDPANTSFGGLVAHDEHLMRPGSGFGAHAHRGVDVVTWVLAGALVHEDAAGHRGVVRPGQVQRMRAGDGVVHSERAHGAGPVRFVQAWLLADGGAGYDLHDVALEPGRLVPVLDRLSVARLEPGQRVAVPDAERVHLFLARGAADLDDAPLGTGDAARLTGAGRRPVVATAPAELLVWAL